MLPTKNIKIGQCSVELFKNKSGFTFAHPVLLSFCNLNFCLLIIYKVIYFAR